MVGGHRLRREEREPGDPVPGELRHDRRGKSGVRPLQILAPVIPHRQRHHHVAQQHRDIDRGVRDQREPERDQRVREDVEREGQVRPDRLAEHSLAGHHRQHRGVQGDDLARAVDHHVAVLLRQPRRPRIALPGPPGAEPVPPGPAQRVVAGDHGIGPEPLPDILADLDVLGPHGDPRAVQRLLPDREDRLPDLRRDAGMAAALPQPPVICAPGQPELPPGALPPEQRAVADRIQAQEPRRLRVHRLELSDLRHPPGRHRRRVRVVLGPGLSRPWPQ